MGAVDLKGLLAAAGDEHERWARTINPQFVRVLRTIGFDRTWARAEGAYLFDADGNRYLDMLGGFGMYNVGRNNPRVRAALVEALELETPGSVQLGVTSLPGPARRGAARADAGPARARALHELRHGGGRGRPEARPRRDEAHPRALGRPRLPRPDARLALGERQPGVHARASALCCPASRACRSATSTRSSGELRTRGRRALPRRADSGQGRRTCRRPAISRARRRSAAATARSSASTRCRPASAARARCSRSSTGGSSRTSCPSRSRSRAATSRSARS